MLLQWLSTVKINAGEFFSCACQAAAIVLTIDTVNNVSQKLNNVPPRMESHMDPGIEKLCRLIMMIA